MADLGVYTLYHSYKYAAALASRRGARARAIDERSRAFH
jgi:hypothetical protein